MTQQSTIYSHVGQYRRIVIAFLLLVFLSAMIVAVAHRACAPVSLNVGGVMHFVTCEADNVHVWESASHAWESTIAEIQKETEIQKDGRMSVFLGYLRKTWARAIAKVR
jgi:hypothetical protein